MNNGAMNTRGAASSPKLFLICGSCFQNASRTSRKIFRRRSSVACWKTGAADWFVQLRAVAEDDQHGIGKVFVVHDPKLAERRLDCKPRRRAKISGGVLVSNGGCAATAAHGGAAAPSPPNWDTTKFN